MSLSSDLSPSDQLVGDIVSAADWFRHSILNPSPSLISIFMDSFEPTSERHSPNSERSDDNSPGFDLADGGQHGDSASGPDSAANAKLSVIQPDAPVPEFTPVDPRNQEVDRVRGLVIASIVFIAAILGPIFSALTADSILTTILVVAGGGLATVVCFAAAFIWPAWKHRHMRYRIDAEGLEIRHGVWWRHQISVPVGRVQHADVSQGPVQRLFGLGTLTVHTAGTQNASIHLEGLEHEYAKSLRDFIVNQRKEQDAV